MKSKKENKLSATVCSGSRNKEDTAVSAMWKKENAEAIASSNKWVNDHGLPLEMYRQF